MIVLAGVILFGGGMCVRDAVRMFPHRRYDGGLYRWPLGIGIALVAVGCALLRFT